MTTYAQTAMHESTMTGICGVFSDNPLLKKSEGL